MINYDFVYDGILRLSQDLMLDCAKPSKELVQEILSMDARKIPETQDYVISIYIVALGQYLVNLQHYENLKNLDCMLAQKKLNFELSKKKFLDDSARAKKTEKEKNAYLVLTDPDVAQLDQEATAAEAEKILVNGMVKAVEQLLNALKKEKSGRDS